MSVHESVKASVKVCVILFERVRVCVNVYECESI